MESNQSRDGSSAGNDASADATRSSEECNPSQTTKFKDNEKVALRLKGLPWRVEKEQVSEFFQDFKIIENSVVLGIGADGRKNGQGTILFDDAEEATSAQEKMHKQYIGERFILLSTITFLEYLNFNSGGSTEGEAKSGGYQNKTVKIADFVNSDNQDNCLVIKGIPFRIKNDEIIEFFSSCGTLTSDKIYIDQVDGRKSGSALVIFENSDAVQEAKSSLNNSDMGGRTVNLFDCNDNFFKKACNLFDN